jgi:O-succinylbenzoate synthase
VQTLIDFDAAPVFAVPVIGGLGDATVREGMLLEGPQGWGEFSPFDDCSDSATARWLTAAIEAGTVGWPDPVRGRIPIAVTVPAVDPDRAHEIVADSRCRTADVTVAVHSGSLAGDLARLGAVRDALGPQGAIRCDANGMWDVDTAVAAIAALARAAGGLEYVAQPCRTSDELIAVRRRIDVPVATTVPIRPGDPLRASLVGTADVAILRTGPLGGARRALMVADACGLPCVVASALETSIGLSAGLALAGALPDLDYACGLGTRSLLSGDVVAGTRSLVPAVGYLPVAPTPPAPDAGLIARYQVTDDGRIAWWRARLGAARAAM